MKSFIFSLAIIFGLTFITSKIQACQWDIDCDAGSNCAIPPNSSVGVCVGGFYPGNQHDRDPASNPSSFTERPGIACQFDTDCPNSGQCLPGDSGSFGTCQ